MVVAEHGQGCGVSSRSLLWGLCSPSGRHSVGCLHPSLWPDGFAQSSGLRPPWVWDHVCLEARSDAGGQARPGDQGSAQPLASWHLS